MIVAYHVRLTGRVQGVFFRAWTQDEANTVRVAGWIRNCADGSVEAHLEGGEADIKELIDLMREGPPGAEVDNVDVESVDPEGLDRFEIRH